MRVCTACGATGLPADWHCGRCGRIPARDGAIALLAPAIAAGDGGDADYHHAALAAAEARHFWFVARRRVIADAVRRHFGRAASLLDVGCGTGGVAGALQDAFPAMSVVAGDVLMAGLRIAQQHAPRVEFVQFDIRALPYRDAFDVVTAFDVLEHVDDDAAVLAQMRAAARPGGGIVVTVPQHQWLWSASDEYSHHRRRYSRRALVAKMHAAGIVVEAVTSFMSVLLPALVASRWRDQRLEAYDPIRELQIGDGMNAVFGALCGIERGWLRAGGTLPAGGSLLAIGRRAA